MRGKIVGRPRQLDYQKIYSLVETGITKTEVAERLGIARSTVNYALWRKRKPPKASDPFKHPYTISFLGS